MKVLVAGDYSPRIIVDDLLKHSDYSFFDEVKQYTAQVDYSIVNFESCIALESDEAIRKTGPNLRCDKNAIDSLRYAGFNCITLANNHFRDYGDIGVANTISRCEELGIDYVGGGLNLESASRILYKEIDGQRLGIINVCENEWSIATSAHGGSAPLNPIVNYYTIKEAKENSDYVLVIVHGGIEMYQYPTPRMQETYRFFIDAGADVVVNHHQHCYGGYEVYQNKPIFYGIGNFCFDQPRVVPHCWKPRVVPHCWKDGYIVIIDFVEKSVSFELFPYKQFDNVNKVEFLVDRCAFDQNVNKINEVISDKQQLTEMFHCFNDGTDLWVFEPYKGKLAHKLYDMHLLPSVFTKRKLLPLHNQLRCESLLDKMIDKLELEYRSMY